MSGLPIPFYPYDLKRNKGWGIWMHLERCVIGNHTKALNQPGGRPERCTAARES
jgi:hypothetical protein